MKMLAIKGMFFFLVVTSELVSNHRVFFGRTIQKNLVQRINQEFSSIRVISYIFTDPVVAQALMRARDRSVDVQCVFDQQTFAAQGNQAENLALHDIQVFVQTHPRMHNKCLIFGNPYKDERVELVTGSYNLTNNAAYRNDENMLFVTDPVLVCKYWRYFQKVRQKAYLLPRAQQ